MIPLNLYTRKIQDVINLLINQSNFICSYSEKIERNIDIVQRKINEDVNFILKWFRIYQKSLLNDLINTSYGLI